MLFERFHHATFEEFAPSAKNNEMKKTLIIEVPLFQK